MGYPGDSGNGNVKKRPVEMPLVPAVYSLQCRWFTSVIRVRSFGSLGYLWSTRGLYKNQYHHTITMRHRTDLRYYQHLHYDTTSTTIITIQDIEQRVNR
eukprot:scaffold307034_cov88-Attheya_sp.AAC.1